MAGTVQERVVDVAGVDMPVEEDMLNCARDLLELRQVYRLAPTDTSDEIAQHDTDDFRMTLLALAAIVVEEGPSGQHRIDSLLQGSLHGAITKPDIDRWLQETSKPTRDVASRQATAQGSHIPHSGTGCVDPGCSQRAFTGCLSTTLPEGMAAGNSCCQKDCRRFDPNVTETDLDEYQDSFEHTDTGRVQQPLDYQEPPVAEPSVPQTKLGKALASNLGPRWAAPPGIKRASKKPQRFHE